MDNLSRIDIHHFLDTYWVYVKLKSNSGQRFLGEGG